MGRLILCTCVHVCVCVWVWRSIRIYADMKFRGQHHVLRPCNSLIYFRQGLSLTQNSPFSYSGWPVSPRNYPVSESPDLGLQVHTTMNRLWTFHMCYTDSILILAFLQKALPDSVSSQPPRFYLDGDPNNLSMWFFPPLLIKSITCTSWLKGNTW